MCVGGEVGNLISRMKADWTQEWTSWFHVGPDGVIQISLRLKALKILHIYDQKRLKMTKNEINVTLNKKDIIYVYMIYRCLSFYLQWVRVSYSWIHCPKWPVVASVWPAMWYSRCGVHLHTSRSVAVFHHGLDLTGHLYWHKNIYITYAHTS